MVERFEHFYRVGYCKIDDKPCPIEGECGMCYWAKIYREEQDLNSQETSNSLEPTKKTEIKQ